jgi:hypothetical protein
MWSVGHHRGEHQGERHALLTFAMVMLFVLAVFNAVDGIAAINRSHVFVGNAHYVFGDLRAWGWVILILAILQGAAAVGILARVEAARWAAVVILGLNAFSQLAFMPSYPAWSLLIIAMDVVAIYGLTAHWDLPLPDQQPARAGMAEAAGRPGGIGPSPHS